MTKRQSLKLWSDEPSAIDLLAFGAVADTVVDAVMDEGLDPVALGVSGTWGSGKTTVLRLVEAALETPEDDDAPKTLTVLTDPWKYDPSAGAKESLIGDVLDRLEKEITATAGAGGEALGVLRKLAKRVDWSKALRMAARTSLTLQLPSPDDLTDLIRTGASDSEAAEPRGLESFKEEFKRLMESAELSHVTRVVVLVDDLDRCLPDTVVETLETIRLFLAVPRMSFVLAADEDRVADAIRQRYPAEPSTESDTLTAAEEPAKLYLHKIVQTTIPLPALSRFDTEAYLLLLQLANRLDDENQLVALIDQCTDLRLRSADLDELPGVEGIDVSAELSFAARLTPLLYEKLRGNPRRIKRFLNDLGVRQSIAERRGIVLDPAIVAKLMVLEVLLPDSFKLVLDWLARNELRDQMRALDAAAGRGIVEEAPLAVDEEKSESATTKPEGETSDPDPAAPEFDDDLIRWAKLPPGVSTVDLGPYLYLAAAFRGTALLDEGLPERLRDLAANLASSVRADQKSVTDDDLRGLTGPDAAVLAEHLTRVIRDRPTEQRAAMIGVLRITRVHSKAVEKVRTLLSAIPPDDLQPAAILSFGPPDVAAFRSVLEDWAERVTKAPTRAALKSALGN